MTNSPFKIEDFKNEDGLWHRWIVATDTEGKVLCYRVPPASYAALEEEWVRQTALVAEAQKRGDWSFAPFNSWKPFDQSQREKAVGYLVGSDTNHFTEERARNLLRNFFLE